MECQVMLTITDKCNLKCTYCYEKKRSGTKEMDFDTAKSIVIEYLNSPVFNKVFFLFFGGEPLLNFSLIKRLCEWTWSKKWKNDYIFEISTNGTLIHGEIAEWFKNNNDRIRVVVSADGDEETQNKNRDGSFQRIDYDILADLGKNVAVKMTVSKESLGRLAHDVIFFHKKNIRFSECNLAEGIKWSEQDRTIFNRELSRLADFYHQNPDIVPAPIVSLELWKCSCNSRINSKCGIQDHLYVYDSNGKRLICNYFSHMSFSENELKKVQNTINKGKCIIDSVCLNECYYYPVCHICVGADYSLKGCFGKRNMSRCKMTESQVFYSAIIRGNLIKKIKIDELDVEKKIKIKYEINAITKVLRKEVI